MAFKRWKQTERGRPATEDDDGAFVTFLGPKAAAGYRKTLKENPPKQTERGRPATEDDDGAFVTFLGPTAAAGYRKMLKENPPPEREKNPDKRD